MTIAEHIASHKQRMDRAPASSELRLRRVMADVFRQQGAWAVAHVEKLKGAEKQKAPGSFLGKEWDAKVVKAVRPILFDIFKTGGDKALKSIRRFPKKTVGRKGYSAWQVAESAEVAVKTFDPNQPRDEDGKWSETGAGEAQHMGVVGAEGHDVYHGTSLANAENELRIGIKNSFKGGDAIIYASPDKSEAFAFAEGKTLEWASDNDIPSGKGRDDLPVALVVVGSSGFDPAWRQAVGTHRPVPKESIRRVEVYRLGDVRKQNPKPIKVIFPSESKEVAGIHFLVVAPEMFLSVGKDKSLSQKGDFDGHPFRGNQYTDGEGGGGSETGAGGAMFHGTSIAAAKQIQKEGLKMSRAQTSSSFNKLIWTTRSFESAQTYGRGEGRRGYAVVILKPEAASLGSDDDNIVTFNKDIPPEMIESVQVFHSAGQGRLTSEDRRVKSAGNLYVVLVLNDSDEWVVLDHASVEKSLSQKAKKPPSVGIPEWVDDPEVIEALEREVFYFAEKIDSTTAEALRDELMEGMEAGESISGLKDRIQGLTDEWADGYRAEMIARTESARAYSKGHIEAWRSTGVVYRKVWVSALDACPFCLDMNGTVIELDATFFDEGEEQEVEWGGTDITLSQDYSDVVGPPLHPNCRCVVVGELAEEKSVSQKGDLDGHPFRGNQYTDVAGEGSGSGEGGGSEVGSGKPLLMHGTSYSSGQQILREGFKPGEGGRVFATPYKRIAVAYGFGRLVRESPEEKPDAKFAVVKFKRNVRGFAVDNPSSTTDTWQWSKIGAVPPEDIDSVEIYSGWDAHGKPLEILRKENDVESLYAVALIK